MGYELDNKTGIKLRTLIYRIGRKSYEIRIEDKGDVLCLANGMDSEEVETILRDKQIAELHAAVIEQGIAIHDEPKTYPQLPKYEWCSRGKEQQPTTDYYGNKLLDC